MTLGHEPKRRGLAEPDRFVVASAAADPELRRPPAGQAKGDCQPGQRPEEEHPEHSDDLERHHDVRTSYVA